MKKLSISEKLILVLSIYVVVELYISSIYQFSQSTFVLLERIDFGICIIFLIDFFYKLYKSESKKMFLKGHWIDFISSIPFIGVLRIGRFVRIIKIFRLIRSGKVFYEYINKNKSITTKNRMINISIIGVNAPFYTNLNHLCRAQNTPTNIMSPQTKK